MNKAAIIVIDDDEDDLDMIEDVCKQIKADRPVETLKSGEELRNFLKQSSDPPFLILCDLNLTKETGFDVKKSLSDDPELKYKSVPFIFWSTTASPQQIQQAYDLPAQGFFFKPSSEQELCNTFKTIMGYWELSQHPKSVR